MPIAHWHSQLELNYLAAGEMTYLISGHLVHLVARRMGVFWGATPHQVVTQRGESDLVVIYVPQPLPASWEDQREWFSFSD